MQRVYFSRISRVGLLALLLGLLAACGGHDEIKQGTSDVGATVPAQYDLVVRADKDGNFDLEGATLTAEDLRSHIRYRNEPGNAPVHTVLLKTGEKEKIKSQHIVALAGIARDLKVDAFVETEGHLKKIVINDQL